MYLRTRLKPGVRGVWHEPWNDRQRGAHSQGGGEGLKVRADEHLRGLTPAAEEHSRPRPPTSPSFLPRPRRPKKAATGADHLHPEPAGGAGGPVCQDPVPGCVRPRGGGSEDQPARVQGSGEMFWSPGPSQPFLGPRAVGGRRGPRGNSCCQKGPLKIPHWPCLLPPYTSRYPPQPTAPHHRSSSNMPAKHTPASGPLHSLFPLPGRFIPHHSV